MISAFYVAVSSNMSFIYRDKTKVDNKLNEHIIWIGVQEKLKGVKMAPSRSEKKKKDSRGGGGEVKQMSTSEPTICCVPKGN